MRICINIKVWQRPEVFGKTLASIFGQETEHEIMVICAISPHDPYYAENIQVAHGHGAKYEIIDNLPLSTKANKLARCSRIYEWDYWMVLGSDDIVGPGFFDAYDFDTHDAWGWTDLYLYQPPRQGQVHLEPLFYYWPGYGPGRDESVGAGRVLSRKIMELIEYAPHPDGLDRNLDSGTTWVLAQHGITVPHGKLPEGVYMVDCKDAVSITPLDAFRGKVQVPVPDGLEGLL